MAAVLEAFASKLGAGGMLMDLAKEEVEMLLGVPGEITKLEATLGDLTGILADAERRRIRDPASPAARWVSELKDVMYDADDILDLCQIMQGDQEVAPKTDSGSGWCGVSMLSCFRNPVAAHEIGKKIKALNQRLEDIASRSSRFGFLTQAINLASSNYDADEANNSWLHDDRKTGSAIVMDDIVGEKIQQDTKKLVDLLVNKGDARAATSSHNGIVVVAISGVGGIGKTTLARMVFNNDVVKGNFDKRIWLSVNQDVNKISMLKRVIAAFGGSYDGLAEDMALLELALKEIVRQKMFLLVMDDVWSDEVWNDLLRVPLSDGVSTSRVLVTTRNDGVARGMKANLLHRHRVDKLSQEDAWSLLKQQVVLNENDASMDNDLKSIGMEIVKKCDGLPLAIKVVGGLLRKKTITRGAWLDVSANDIWSVTPDDDLNKAVYVSYDELPCHLKQCLLYCSLIPKDELIRRGVMVNLWMAEGYLQKKAGSKLPDDLGREYYKELITRNLLEPDKKSYDHSACTMHDVVRSFGQYIMKYEGALVTDKNNINSVRGASLLRNLSISNIQVERGDLPKKRFSPRTLMLFGCSIVEWKDFLGNNLSCVRVLHLDGVNISKLPDSICHLKHLRYLGLTNTSISTLPRGIGDLKFLQCIDIVGANNFSQLPKSILKLRKLRSLHFLFTKITSIPRGFENLEDLVHVYGFPTHSDGSVDGWCSLQELGSLSRLRELYINGLEKAPCGMVASRAELSNKSNLTDLTLEFTTKLGKNGEEEANISKEEQKRVEVVLGHLCPPTCVERLTIRGYFGYRLPQWMRRMSCFGSLRRLELCDYACCEQLPDGLGQLPCLDCLWIKHAPSIQRIGNDLLLPASTGREVAGRRQHPAAAVAFPKLVNLGLTGMSGWKEWEWQEHVPGMPALEYLTIAHFKLVCLPIGLAQQASKLRCLMLSDSSHLVSVDSFPRLIELRLLRNARLERIANNPSLQEITIFRCPGVKALKNLPSLRNIIWKDCDANVLPQYLREANLMKLHVDCSLTLLKSILRSLHDAAGASEWENIQQLNAFGYESPEGTEVCQEHIFYTREPYSLETSLSSPQHWDEHEDDEVEEQKNEGMVES